jgi:hypothetical protein
MKTRFLPLLLPILMLLFVSNVSAQNDCTVFKTFSQGLYGNDGDGGYLQSHFTTAFPHGLIIGTTNRLVLTNAEAVKAFLPSGTTSRALPFGTLTNPIKKTRGLSGYVYENNLAGQLVTLLLNVTFDALDPDFSPASCKLGDQIINTGPFKGMTVSEFLDLANEIIGGGGGLYSPDQLGAAAGSINLNYDNGNVGDYVTSAPPEVSLLLAAPVLCNGDNTASIVSAVSGGVAPFTYLWSNGSTVENLTGVPAGPYSLTVTDSRGIYGTASITVAEPTKLEVSATGTNLKCFESNDGTATLAIVGGTPPYTISWSNGGDATNLTGLAIGTFDATVTDHNSCSAVASVTLTQPEKLAASATVTNVTCFGGNDGKADLTISGGTAPISVKWSTGNETLSGVVAGAYLATVTDANGCFVEVPVTIDQPTKLEASITSSNVTCFGSNDGTADLTITGGKEPYTISWTNNSEVANLSGLAPALYVATVTDKNGCQVAASVTITQPDQLVATATSTDVTCFGSNNGTAELVIKGGTEPYSISWTNSTSVSSSLTGLAPGTYVASVIDAKGCTTSTSVTIKEPELLEMTAVISNVTCNGAKDGKAELTVKGGTAPYFINWPNGTDASVVTGLDEGTYDVSVNDANGCLAATTVVITQPAELAVVANVTNILCYGDTNGSATLTVTGGTAPYTYLWTGGKTTESVSGLAPGDYNVVVEDANHCTAGADFTVTQPAQLVINNIAVTNVTCEGCNGSAVVTVTGGTPNYTYNWLGKGVQSSNTASLPDGTWQLIVTDANGCTATGSAVITTPISYKHLTTITQGGWGAKASGNNWGTYLNNHYAGAFPTGISVGYNGRFLTLNSTNAIRNFLPNSGTPTSLKTGTASNPTSNSLKNTLAGQVVALTINMAFDNTYPDFGASNGYLRDMVVATGTFRGWPVTQVLLEANKALGASSSYSATSLTDVLDAINQNFDNGTVNKGFLMPGCAYTSLLSAEEQEQMIQASEYPAMTVDNTFVSFMLNVQSKVVLNVYNLNGQLVGNLFTGTVKPYEAQRVAINSTVFNDGVYMVRLITDTGVKNAKIVVK